MRIVLFPSAYSPAVGGVEELTARLARRLIELGDDVEVWTNQYPSHLAQCENVDGVRVRRFPLPMPRLAASTLVRLPRAVATAREMMGAAAARFKPSVIHVQCFSANGPYATWLARRSGARLVITLQGESLMDDADIYDHSVTLRFML
jgi:glycogen(starch) synthase